MGVFKVDLAHRGLAHVGNDVLALQRVVLQELGNGRLGRTLVVHKEPQTLAFKKRNPPAVGMVVGAAAALAKAGEAERSVGGGGAVETEKLALDRDAIVRPRDADGRGPMPNIPKGPMPRQIARDAVGLSLCAVYCKAQM